MKRTRITATQLADFWRCPRKAWFTDRLSPEDRDPDHPVRRRILDEGNAHEARLIAALPEVSVLHAREDGFEKTFEETKRLMERGVPAIHHGILLRAQENFTWLAEPDLLEKTGDVGPRGNALYRVVEIKNSAAVNTSHLVQLALNAFILEEWQGGASEHQVMDHEGRRNPVRMEDCSAIMARVREDCVHLLGQDEPPSYHRSASCLACDFTGVCRQKAESMGELGLVHGLGPRELAQLGEAGIHRLKNLAEADGSKLMRDFPGRGRCLVHRAKALVEGGEIITEAHPAGPPNSTWLLHAEKDVARTKRLCLFAGIRFDGSGLFFHAGETAEAAAEAFFRGAGPVSFWTTRSSVRSLLREGFLVPKALGDPRRIHEVRSLEEFTLSCRSLPFEPAPLNRILHHFGLVPAPIPDSLETYYQEGVDALKKETGELLEAARRLPARLGGGTP